MNIIDNNNINIKVFIKFLSNINKLVCTPNTANTNIIFNKNYICENYFKSIIWFYKYYININIYNFNWNFINNKITQLNIGNFINYLQSLNKDFLNIKNCLEPITSDKGTSKTGTSTM
jgi:hypothetical protein